MDTYKLVEGLTVPQNTVKAAIFNGSRILQREISRGSFYNVTGDKEATYIALQSVVKHQLAHVIDAIDGTHPDKETVIEKLRQWLISEMLK